MGSRKVLDMSATQDKSATLQTATDDCHFSLCKRCANGIYPSVRDFIVYFGGHLNVIKTSYTKYVKIY